MDYGLLADLVLILHLCFVLFVVLGALLILRWRWLLWLHLPAVAWGVVIEFAGWPCPLTPLEQKLRRMSGEAGFAGGFVDHYIVSLLYPEGLTRTWQIVVGLAVLAINVILYWAIFSRACRTRRRSAAR